MHIGMKLKKNFKNEKWDVKAEDKKITERRRKPKVFHNINMTLLFIFHLFSAISTLSTT
jgi:hypothetical protein